jgi:hypothetical protein
MESIDNKNNDLRTFIKNEVLKIHKKVMLETEKIKINKMLQLIREGINIDDSEGMVNQWVNKLELFIAMLGNKHEIMKIFPDTVGSLSDYFNDEILDMLKDENGSLDKATINDFDDLLEKKVDLMSTEELINVVGADLLDADLDRI